jgi:hypothetical protein
MTDHQSLEVDYNDLVLKRGQLKGISNKNELNATKKEIMTVTTKLKKSTKDICSKLQDTPNTEGNNNKVTEHKKLLIQRVREAQDELGNQLTFQSFKHKLEDDKETAGQYEKYITLDRELTLQIKEIIANIHDEEDTFARETEEQN